MCRTTERRRTAAPSVNAPAQIPKPKTSPPIKRLKEFLDAAYATEKAALEPTATPAVVDGFTLKNKETAISIVMIDNDGNHEEADINGTRMDYSGSLVKVAALYAAFDLRCEARKHAKDNSFSAPNAFHSSFSSAIDVSTAIQRLKNFDGGRKPHLNQIFDGFTATGPNQVRFKQQFQIDLDGVFNNENIGRVIRALGYSYINVSMMRGKFFKPDPDLNGIWLAGDYSKEKITKSVRVPVTNDTVAGGSGQAIITNEMRRMFRLVHTKQGFSHVADTAERDAANDGVHSILVTQTSFFFDPDNPLTVTPAFSADCAKVGIGNLGPVGTPPNPNVYSEGAVMKWNNTAEVTSFNSAKERKLSGDFAVCWQNLYAPNSHFDAMIRVLNTSIRNFLIQ